MTLDQRERLRSIKDFPDLVAYLHDELDWPVGDSDFEDLTYEYTPEELGIDEANAAKILDIKRLRPLAAAQPWGIFFVSFEPKRLPVVALRRILGSVAVKRRASANPSDRLAWKADDLLFISNFGAGDPRQISFAHFSIDQSKQDLPTLKVLGWDDCDTPLHLDAVADTLQQSLAWPEDPSDTQAWKHAWGAAFSLRHREVITTSRALALRLAELARGTRERILTVLSIETEAGPVSRLMRAFKEALIHDLDAEGFADMYAQTIAYGLLSARVAHPKRNTAAELASTMPATTPFLRELMETFLTTGGRKSSGLDFDELGVGDVVELLDAANMEAVLRDFGDNNPDEDPVIHFYELFLKEYDPGKRMQRGVFYTPRPVVSFIVRSVDELIRSEFGLDDGLAATATWGEMVAKHEGLGLPAGTSPQAPFVQVLDPATGTGTFLVEIIDVIYGTLRKKWAQSGQSEVQIHQSWNRYVPRHLLPRLYGYELLMAPYAIAHLKVGLKLHETGYEFAVNERTRIYLTNTLEPPSDAGQQALAGTLPALAHEAHAVNESKREQVFTVVLGNPPYSVTSANSNDFIDTLMNDYKKHVQGERGLVALADDYLKFIRFSQFLLERAQVGIWGMITNHGYLRGIIHTGVRKELLDQFDSLSITDLHGDSNIGERVPAGMKNENVFAIQQGVAVAVAVKSLDSRCKDAARVKYRDVWGTQSEKTTALGDFSESSTEWCTICPTEPRFFLMPFDSANSAEYQAFTSITELMPVNSCGVKTHRDGLLIDRDRDALIARMSEVASEADLSMLREKYGIRDTPHWRLSEARSKIVAADVPDFVRPLTYRPFDDRWIYYNPAIIEKGDSKYPTLRHMLSENVALLTSRIQATGVFDAVFVTRKLAEMKTAESSRSCTVFPLYVCEGGGSSQASLLDDHRRPNLSVRVADSTGRLTPEEVLAYIYALLHSPSYRNRYSQFLRIDYPRIPLSPSDGLLHELAGLGQQLIALHLLEPNEVQHPLAEYRGSNAPMVKRIAWSEGTVWLDAPSASRLAGGARGTEGFHGVLESVWEFRVGGYRVCEKWLKDRKDRPLSQEDIALYQRIIAALTQSVLLMGEIDAAIERHGGLPFAIQGASQSEAVGLAAENQSSYGADLAENGGGSAEGRIALEDEPGETLWSNSTQLRGVL